MIHFSFDESIRYLEDLYHQPLIPAEKVGLQRAAILLDRLGNPHRSFRAVHVAGSSGKGSTTSMIGSIMRANGARTGFFRSPHLVSYTERIAVDGVDISPADWADVFGRLYPVVEAMRDDRLPGFHLGRPSLFEVLFALMATYFQQAGVEWAAVETGLGGRLDATNLLSPEVAVVTNVSLEHTRILGDTVGEIAHEKAAIIKSGGHAVTASSDPEALKVIRGRAAEVGAPLLEVGRDVLVAVESQSLGGQRIALRGAGTEFVISLPCAGDFQRENAAAAFGAALAMRERGASLSDQAIRRGLEGVSLPGRFEVASTKPLIILDGAHNPAAARALRHSIEHLLAGCRLVLVVGTLVDKDIGAMARELAPLSELVIVTRTPGSERAASLGRLEEAFRPWSTALAAVEDAEQAVAYALRTVDRDSVLLVTGSLYLVGFARSILLRTVAQ